MKVKIIFILFIIINLSCKKNSNKNPVPSISFDITINFALPSYSALTGVGGWAYVNNVGSRGVIVYRKGTQDFVAFDRHSPEDPDGKCKIPLTPDSANFLQLKDSCSGAIFSLYDGSAISGSKYGLRQYAVSFDGNNSLRIFN
ncbi:MAG: hypothetical protein HYR91_04095 [Flavobacteriia bacterium]|nr:hypothetical protein [Flavobacteriia bacterium]